MNRPGAHKIWGRLAALVPILILVGLNTGCLETTGQSLPHKTAPPPMAASQKQAPQGPVFAVHHWRADDSLLFLALYYADDESALNAIEQANPWLDFESEMAPGTVVWIPKTILIPRLSKTLPLKPKPESLKNVDTAAYKTGDLVKEQDLGSTSPGRILSPRYTSRFKIHQHHKVSAKRPLR